MRKIWIRLLICTCITMVSWGMMLSDREVLNENIIRFHVVANSDSEEDQAVKLQVRDAVLNSIQEDLKNVADVEQAKAYLQDNLPKIEEIANQVLRDSGFSEAAVVTLCKEAFETRRYDTFSLPAGVYEALRITIGEGEGRNWWCVTFPAFCLPAAEKFTDVAAGAGFSERLSETLEEPETYELRFYFLDMLGRMENNLFASK